MKKEFLFFFLAIFFISIVSAVEVQIKENVNLGETLLVKVSGNFLENIQKSDISFYRRHLSTSFEDYNIQKIGEDYYIYVAIDRYKLPDNYSVQIKGVNYMEGAKIINSPIIGNFTILDNLADFSLTPGIIKTDYIFSIKIQNLQNKKINLTVYDDTSENYDILSGEIINLFFDVKSGIRIINFNSANQSYDFIVENPIIPQECVINETILNCTLNEECGNGNICKEGLCIKNETNLTCVLNEDCLNGKICVNNECVINLTNFSCEKDSQCTMYGRTCVDNKCVNESGFFIINETTGEVKSCEEMEGKICNIANQTCGGEKQTSDGAECCLGTCLDKKPNNSKKIVGWVLISIIVIIFAWFFLKKYRGTKKKKIDLEKESRGKNLPPLPPPRIP